jgi:signal transduction histidine kinase/CheY-like chemotaxis protein
MQLSLTSDTHPTQSKSDIDYLRYDYLMVMIAVIGVVAGAGVLRASYCWPRTLIACAWPTPLLLAATALGAYGLRNFSQRLASWVLIGGMLLANIAEIWRFPDGPAPYLLALVVIVSATLRSARNAWGVVAFAASMLVIMAEFLSPDLTLKETQGPLLMLLLTGLVAWSSTRQFYTAVDWALYSVRVAQARATEAQAHRAEVVRVNKALDDAFQRLERMNHMLILAHRSAEEARLHKTQFANAVSHELRSPINMIIGFSEMMVNAPEVYGPQAWPPRLRQHITQVYQSAQHLSQLIDDVLDMARIDTHRMALNKQPTPVSEIVEEAVDLVQSLYEARQLYLQVEIAPGLPSLSIDRTRIRQVLLNLLTNALRFTQTGGVTVRVYREADSLVTQVIDTGPGISPENLPVLFQEFRQLEGSFYQWGKGSGLGLAISKRLIELHDGHIRAESIVGQGSAFTVALPIQASGWQARLQAEETENAFWQSLEREAQKRQRVLAYAEEPARRLLASALSAYDVVWVHNEADLSQTAADVFPTAVVCLGGSMRRENGLPQSFVRQLPQIPIIVCTLPGLSGRPLKSIFAHYLVKPVLRANLEAVLPSLGRELNDIVVIDDDVMMLDYLTTALSTLYPNCRVRTAQSAAEATQLVQAAKPDVILLDFGLPDMDGRELAPQLNALLDGQAPIIAITAEDYPAEESGDEPDEIHCFRKERFSQMEIEGALQAILSNVSAGGREVLPTESTTVGATLVSA